MDVNEIYFLQLLGAFVRGKPAPFSPQVVDWERICMLGRIHSVSGILYSMVKALPASHQPPYAWLVKLKKEFLATLARCAEQEEKLSPIMEQMEAQGIAYLFFKGFEIRCCYPIKELRVSGDIDLLVHPRSLSPLKEIVYAYGFHAIDLDDDVWSFASGDLTLEVHTKLIYHNIHNQVDYVSYFSDAWDHAAVFSQGYRWQLKKEYHLLYLFVHMAKHFDGSGCGVRMLLDVTAYIHHYGELLDWTFLRQEFEYLKLDTFVRRILFLCRRWFGLKIPEYNFEMDEIHYEDLCAFILSGGTFGFYGRDIHAKLCRDEYRSTDHQRHIRARIRAYRKICFPSRSNMIIYGYPILQRYPVMLPFTWFHRGMRSIFSQNRTPLRLLHSMANTRLASQEQFEILCNLGLIQEQESGKNGTHGDKAIP